jgi:hypothetical protein
MKGRCAFCGRPPDRLHHPTGRNHEGRYLDPLLVLPAEHDCHEFVHDDWRHERLDKLQKSRTSVEYIAIRLRRLAMNLGRIDQHLEGGTFWGLLAEAFHRWADELDDHVRRLDRRDPAWRHEEGSGPNR